MTVAGARENPLTHLWAPEGSDYGFLFVNRVRISPVHAGMVPRDGQWETLVSS